MADDEKELKDQRVVTMMSPSELEAIDNWMFANRVRSRGEAIRRLTQTGRLFHEAGMSIRNNAAAAFTLSLKELDADSKEELNEDELILAIEQLRDLRDDLRSAIGLLALELDAVVTPGMALHIPGDIGEALKQSKGARAELLERLEKYRDELAKKSDEST